MLLSYPLRNLGSRETSTVTGVAVKRLFGSSGASGNSPSRAGVQICNHDSTLALFAKLVQANAALPAISATDHDYRIPPGDSLFVPAASSVDVCLTNSSGGPSPAAYSALEVQN